MLSLITLVVAVVAAAFAWLQLRASLYVRRREFEDIYVQRYWEVSGRIDVELRIASYRQAELPPITNSEQRKAIWDYLALCEDELDLREHGNVTDEAWAVWSSAITGSVNRYPYSHFFDEIEADLARAGVPVNERPFQQLRAFREGGSDELVDPFTMSKLGRYWTGRREHLLKVL